VLGQILFLKLIEVLLEIKKVKKKIGINQDTKESLELTKILQLGEM